MNARSRVFDCRDRDLSLIARHEWHKVSLGDFPSVERWYQEISARPAVARGMAVPA